MYGRLKCECLRHCLPRQNKRELWRELKGIAACWPNKRVLFDGDLACVDVHPAIPLVFAQELELRGTDIFDVEHGEVSFDVGHVVDVILSHVNKQGATVTRVEASIMS